MASLKLADHAQLVEDKAPIPRPRGRGLIEADLYPTLACVGIGEFHDRAVVASLKPPLLKSSLVKIQQFHDRAVVASLKQ